MECYYEIECAKCGGTVGLGGDGDFNCLEVFHVDCAPPIQPETD